MQFLIFVIKKGGIFSSWVSAYQEHPGDVAGAEDLVDDGELVGVVGGEEGREDAVLGAPPPQQLARRARRPAAHVNIYRNAGGSDDNDDDRIRKWKNATLESIADLSL